MVKEVLEEGYGYKTSDALNAEAVNEAGEIYNYENILADIAINIDIIIEKHSKVDWHDNVDVHNKIAQEIDDLLYLYGKKHPINLDYNQIDRIIENVKTVALRRY